MQTKTIKEDAKRQRIARNIARYRKRRGMTQKELATKMGVSQGLVSEYELGKVKKIPYERVQDFARAFGVKTREIVGRPPRKPKQTATTTHTGDPNVSYTFNQPDEMLTLEETIFRKKTKQETYELKVLIQQDQIEEWKVRFGLASLTAFGFFLLAMGILIWG